MLSVINCIHQSAFSHQVVFLHTLPSNHCAAAVLQLMVNIWCNNYCFIVFLPAKAVPGRVGFHPWQCCLEQAPHPVRLHSNSSPQRFLRRTLDHSILPKIPLKQLKGWFIIFCIPEPQITGVDNNVPMWIVWQRRKGERSGKRSSSVGGYESSSCGHLLSHSKPEKLVPGGAQLAVLLF